MRWFRRNAAAASRFRLLYATDLHGADRTFRKLLNAALAYEAHAVLIGGDLTGKVLVPFVRQPHGGWLAAIDGEPRLFPDDRAAEAAASELADQGVYVLRCDPDTVERLDGDPAFRDAVFLRLMQERLAHWASLAQERLAPRGIRFLWNCGNDDPLELDPFLADLPGAEFLEGRVVPLVGRVRVASVGAANLTPWRCPRDLPEEELARRIDAVVAQIPEPDLRFAVFNFHCPPYGSGLDLAPRLDETLKPVVVGGVVETVPVGSTAVRAAIEQYAPQLGLHGHIHESRGAHRLGRTLCLNPGSEYREGVLRAALIDFDGDAVRNYLLVSA
ncbi:MAG: metallophosphoesterase [Thermomicrobium sp.]|nr:metallophosphoesterase [Thermomicrobium sp.]MDW8060323.1 metallophosphoesterase [Thermomicrobium sp.]